MSADANSDECKLNVILDIDETFVYFIKNAFLPKSWDLYPGEKSKYKVHTHSQGIFIERPHLETFLDYLFKNCNVSVWTWSDREYAEGIVDKFLIGKHTDRRIAHIFSEEDASASSELHGHSKDLNYLWYTVKLPCFAECNTILIDDLPNNSVNPSNAKNSITIKPFALFGEVKDRSDPYEDVSNDTALLEVIEILKTAKTIANKCYKNDDKHWTNLFSPENIRGTDIEKHIVSVKTKDGKVVEAVGAKGVVLKQQSKKKRQSKKRYSKKKSHHHRRHKKTRRQHKN